MKKNQKCATYNFVFVTRYGGYRMRLVGRYAQ